MIIEIIVHKNEEYRAWKVTTLDHTEWPDWLQEAYERDVVICGADGRYSTGNSQFFDIGDYVIDDEIPAVLDDGEFHRNFKTIRIEAT